MLALAVAVGASAVAANVRAAWLPRRGFLGLGDQFQLVDFRLEPVIVGGDGIDHLPDSAIRALAHGVMWGRPGRAGDGQDDVAEPLALGLAHDPADRLNHIDLRPARVQEHDGVQRGDVYAFGQASGVGKDSAYAVGWFLLEPRKTIGAGHGILRPIHVPDLASELGIFGTTALFGVGRYATLDHLREVFGEPFGLCDRVAERHRSHGWANVASKIHVGRPSFAKPIPASDHPPAVVHVQFRARVRQQVVEVGTHLLQVDIEYQDLVVRQDAHFDSLAETETVELWTIDLLIVHRSEGRESVVVFRPALGCIGVYARRCGHVQPLVPDYEVVVVDAPKVGFGFAGQVRARGAMRLVANYQVELG